MIDENLIKALAKKYDLDLKYEYNKPGVNSYTLFLDGNNICYYSSFRAGWVQVCTQVYVDWFFIEKPRIGFGDKHSMRNEKMFLDTMQYLVLTYNKIKGAVSQIQKEVKIDNKLNDIEKDFKND